MTGTNYQKVLNIISPEFDELYVVTQDVINATHIFTARGQSLDNIGTLLDFSRSSTEIDSVYRANLMKIIGINAIAGTKTAIIELLSSYLDINESEVQIRETAPGYIIIRLPEEFQSYDMDIKDILYRSVAAGVYVGIHYTGNYWDEDTWDNSEDTSGWG